MQGGQYTNTDIQFLHLSGSFTWLHASHYLEQRQFFELVRRNRADDEFHARRLGQQLEPKRFELGDHVVREIAQRHPHLDRFGVTGGGQDRRVTGEGNEVKAVRRQRFVDFRQEFYDLFHQGGEHGGVGGHEFDACLTQCCGRYQLRLVRNSWGQAVSACHK